MLLQNHAKDRNPPALKTISVRLQIYSVRCDVHKPKQNLTETSDAVGTISHILSLPVLCFSSPTLASLRWIEPVETSCYRNSRHSWAIAGFAYAADESWGRRYAANKAAPSWGSRV